MPSELRELLAADYDIEVVQDGAELIESSRRSIPDAIVCDIAMPRVNGLAAAARILATCPDARIVIVTVLDSRAVIKKALECGARGYVLKSDAGNELATAVRTAIDGHLYLSTAARRALGKGKPPPSLES